MTQETQQRTGTDLILNKIQELEVADRKKVIKTRARRAKIREEYVGHTLGVFNGRGYTNVRITDEMIGQLLGKVAPRVAPTARSKFLSIPPRKMRQVGSLIVGLPVEKALNVLNFTPKIAAHHMAKTLKAAVANRLSVEGTANLDPEHLVVKTVEVGAGPTAKRISYRSMGRVYRIRKRYCHLNIYLEVDKRKKEASDVAAAAKSAPKTKKAAPNKTAAKKTAAKKTVVKKAAAKKTAAKKTAKPAAAKKKTSAADKNDKK